MAMAAAANTGFKRIPKNGYMTPAVHVMPPTEIVVFAGFALRIIKQAGSFGELVRRTHDI